MRRRQEPAGRTSISQDSSVNPRALDLLGTTSLAVITSLVPRIARAWRPAVYVSRCRDSLFPLAPRLALQR